MERPGVKNPSDDPTWDETERLARRLEQLSKRVQALQFLLVILVLGLVGGGYALVQGGIVTIAGGGDAVAKSIKAREIGLVNRKGDRLVLADDDKFGNPNLIFMDLQKNYRMGIKVWPEGNGTPGMVFYDHSGTRGTFRMMEDGAAVLNLMGEGGKGGISLSVAPDSTPSLKLTDKAGKVLFEVPTPAPTPN